ncbi:MAG TPA: hypothetical protein VFV99_11405 [Kofleriaceae bacterium]|nr:hypothetical protein [Kofleriaceae bacterium]
MKRKDKKTKVVSNVVVGKPDVEPSTPSHVRGVFEGNHPHVGQRHKGIKEVSEDRAEGTARRSTGIRPKDHDVIDPRMPKISPA